VVKSSGGVNQLWNFPNEHLLSVATQSGQKICRRTKRNDWENATFILDGRHLEKPVPGVDTPQL
jgi:hypothetical protein